MYRQGRRSGKPRLWQRRRCSSKAFKKHKVRDDTVNGREVHGEPPLQLFFYRSISVPIIILCLVRAWSDCSSGYVYLPLNKALMCIQHTCSYTDYS